MSLFKRDKKEDLVACDTCHCLLRREDAKKVVSVWGHSLLYTGTSHSYFCGTDAPPYETRSSRNGVVRYFAQIEVDANGKPVGFDKKKK